MPPCTSSAMPPASAATTADKTAPANHYQAAAAKRTTKTTTTTTEKSEAIADSALPAPEQQRQQLEQTSALARLSTTETLAETSADQTIITTTISSSPPIDHHQETNTNNNSSLDSLPTYLTAINMNPQSVESGIDSGSSSSSGPSLGCPSINGGDESGSFETVDFGEKESKEAVKEVQTSTSTFDLESGQQVAAKTTTTAPASQPPARKESRLIAYLKRASNVSPFFHKWFSAFLYAACSTLIMLINKIVLTSYSFPSFKILALGQMLATVVLLHLARSTGIVTFPRFSLTVVRNIFPIPLLYAGNLLSGLGSTKQLNLPMYTVLRRIAILFTMIAEYWLLSVHQTPAVQATVYMMVGGAVVAAFDDLAFDLLGYIYVLLNDLFTASYSVYIKKKLDANDLSKYGLLYYNALFMLVPILAISLAVDDWHACFLTFPHWSTPGFVISFTLSCVMGFVLMYATVLCTEHNSALTTAIVGCLRSILVTYLGMFIGGDYIFSAINFAGVSISVLGSLIYTYVTFIQKHIGGRKGKEGDDAKEKVSAEEVAEKKEKTEDDQQQQVPEIKLSKQ